MRYFLTINASHPYIAGGLTFVFEPVQNRGGSWLGVLAVAEDAAASSLAEARLFGVDETDAENYDRLKKKQMGIPDALNGSPKPQRVRTPGANAGGVRLVEPQAGIRGVGNPLIHSKTASETASVIEAVSLQSTSMEPPAEPLLDMPSIKVAKRYTAKPRS